MTTLSEIENINENRWNGRTITNVAYRATRLPERSKRDREVSTAHSNIIVFRIAGWRWLRYNRPCKAGALASSTSVEAKPGRWGGIICANLFRYISVEVRMMLRLGILLWEAFAICWFALTVLSHFARLGYIINNSYRYNIVRMTKPWLQYKRTQIYIVENRKQFHCDHVITSSCKRNEI